MMRSSAGDTDTKACVQLVGADRVIRWDLMPRWSGPPSRSMPSAGGRDSHVP